MNSTHTSLRSIDVFRHPDDTGRRPRVALLIESSRAYGRGLLTGISRYVRQHGPWSIFLQERSLGESSPGWLRTWQGDGMIARVDNRPLAEAICRLGLPTVDVRFAVADLCLPSVRTNDEEIARLAAEHLMERGFQHFAFCGFNGADFSDLRRDYFVRHLQKAGFICEVFDDPQRPRQAGTLRHEEHGLKYEDRVVRWLAKLPRPIGLMACNDVRGQQVLNACRAIGVAVPDDIAVIGVDNDVILCELSDPPLSSVMPNCERIGYEAAGLLAALMNGGQAPATPLYVEPAGIVTRRSTEVLAIEDRHIATAARYIREHACAGITVTDVLRQVPLSRSTLERRYVQMLGRSPKEDILRARLNRAKQLLVETDFALPLIAEKIGFEHPEYLNVIFKKKTGLTPGQYRTQASHPGD